MMKFGAHMYTLRREAADRDGLLRCLDRVAEMGYDGIQASGIACLGDTVSFAELGEMLRQRGLECGATHRSWDALRGDPSGEIARHQDLGCGYTAIGMAPGEVMNGGPVEWNAFLAEYRSVSDQLAEGGLRLGYHNHAQEFQRTAEGRLMDAMIAAEWLPLEIDTYWVHLGGFEVAPLLRRLVGRLEVVHLKDVNVYENTPDMAPLGEGNFDWPPILAALTEGRCEWAMVEQDECRRDPLDCLASSLTFLRSLK
jgi:sugar phosphate isomerase/epimerase